MNPPFVPQVLPVVPVPETIAPLSKKVDLRRLHFTRASERGNISRRGNVKLSVTATSILQDNRRKLRESSNFVINEMMNAILIRLYKTKRISKQEHAVFLKKYNGVHPHDIRTDCKRDQEIFELCRRVVNYDFLTFAKRFSPSVSKHVQSIRSLSKKAGVKPSKARRHLEHSKCRDRQAGFDRKYELQGVTEIISKIKSLWSSPPSDIDMYPDSPLDDESSVWTTIFGFLSDFAGFTVQRVMYFFSVTLPKAISKFTRKVKQFFVNMVLSIFPSWKGVLETILGFSAPVLVSIAYYFLFSHHEHGVKISIVLMMLSIPGFLEYKETGEALIFGTTFCWFTLYCFRVVGNIKQTPIDFVFIRQDDPNQLPYWTRDIEGTKICSDGVFRPPNFPLPEVVVHTYEKQFLEEAYTQIKNFSFRSLGISEWLPSLRETATYLSLANSGVVAAEKVPTFLMSAIENVYIFIRGEPFDSSQRGLFHLARKTLPLNQKAINDFIEKRTYASATAVIEQHKCSQSVQVSAMGKNLPGYLVPFAESAAVLARFYPEAVAYRTSTRMKPEPVGILFCGEPGIGKGVFVMRLAEAIAHHFKIPYKSEQELVFAIKSGDVRFPGDQYYGQLVAYLDDFGMNREPEVLSSEIKTLCSFVDTSCRPLDTSSVATKGTVFSTSPIVMATTNLLRPIGNFESKETHLADPVAFYRRFTVYHAYKKVMPDNSWRVSFDLLAYLPKQSTTQFYVVRKDVSEQELCSSIIEKYASNIGILHEIQSTKLTDVFVHPADQALIDAHFAGENLHLDHPSVKAVGSVPRNYEYPQTGYQKQSGKDGEVPNLQDQGTEPEFSSPVHSVDPDMSEEERRRLPTSLEDPILPPLRQPVVYVRGPAPDYEPFAGTVPQSVTRWMDDNFVPRTEYLSGEEEDDDDPVPTGSSRQGRVQIPRDFHDDMDEPPNYDPDHSPRESAASQSSDEDQDEEESAQFAGLTRELEYNDLVEDISNYNNGLPVFRSVHYAYNKPSIKPDAGQVWRKYVTGLKNLFTSPPTPSLDPNSRPFVTLPRLLAFAKMSWDEWKHQNGVICQWGSPNTPGHDWNDLIPVYPNPSPVQKPLYYTLHESQPQFMQYASWQKTLTMCPEEFKDNLDFPDRYEMSYTLFYDFPADFARNYLPCHANDMVGQIRCSGILGAFQVPPTNNVAFLLYCSQCPVVHSDDPSELLDFNKDPFNIYNWSRNSHAFDENITPFKLSQKDFDTYATEYWQHGFKVLIMEKSWFEMIRIRYANAFLAVTGVLALTAVIAALYGVVSTWYKPKFVRQSKFVRKEDPKRAKFVPRVKVPDTINRTAPVQQQNEEVTVSFANNNCTIVAVVESVGMFGGVDVSRRTTKGLLLNDHAILIPRHILGADADRDSETVFPSLIEVWIRGKCHLLEQDDLEVAPLANRDVCLLGITTKKKAIPGVRSIVDKFVEAKQFTVAHMPTLRFHLDRSDDKLEFKTRVIVPYEIWEVKPALGCYSFEAKSSIRPKRGDCGSLYICSKGNADQTNKIFGMHVGYWTEFETLNFEPLVREDVVALLKLAFPQSYMNQCLEEKGGLIPLYSVSHCEQASLPAKNSIVRSIVHGEWTPVVTAPSLVNSEPPTPLQVALENFPVTPVETKLGSNEYLARDYLRSKLPPPKDSEFSDVKIFREGRVLKTTSPGFPHYVHKHFKKGDLFARVPEFGDYQTHTYLPYVAEILHEVCSNLEKGVSVPFIPSVASLKVEVLPLGHIEVKKTRLFYVASFIWYIMQHVLFSPLLDAMISDPIKGISSVGLNVHGPDWAFMWARFQSNVKCSDYKYFDKNHNREFRSLAISATQDYFHTYFGKEIKATVNGREYTWNTDFAVSQLIEAAYQPFIVGRTVYVRGGDQVLNNSGMYLTWYNNCCQNVLVNILFIIEIAKTSGVEVTTSWLDSVYQISTHGDDVVDSFTCSELAHLAHPLAFATFAKRHGFFVTSAHKEIPLTDQFESDPMYLKRRPVLVDGVVRAQRTEADILQSLYWRDSRSTISAKEHMLASFQSALIDFHHYGRDIYNKWARIFYEKARHHGLLLKVDSYEDVALNMAIRPVQYGTWSMM